MISGCRRQLTDAAVFLPFLTLAILAGIGVLIFNFWLANWQPSLFSGCVAILFFVCTPMTAMLIWQRWRLRSGAADTVLTLLPEGLRITSTIHNAHNEVIQWPWIEVARCRNLTAQHRTLRLIVHDADYPARRTTIEFALCADQEDSERFVREVASCVKSQSSC